MSNALEQIIEILDATIDHRQTLDTQSIFKGILNLIEPVMGEVIVIKFECLQYLVLRELL